MQQNAKDRLTKNVFSASVADTVSSQIREIIFISDHVIGQSRDPSSIHSTKATSTVVIFVPLCLHVNKPALLVAFGTVWYHLRCVIALLTYIIWVVDVVPAIRLL